MLSWYPGVVFISCRLQQAGEQEKQSKSDYFDDKGGAGWRAENCLVGDAPLGNCLRDRVQESGSVGS